MKSNVNQDEMKCELKWDEMWIKMRWNVNQDKMSCDWNKKSEIKNNETCREEMRRKR